jgi:hypothetical protein
MNFQQNVTHIAQAAKAPFQQLTDAAKQVYDTYQNVIDVHKQIADKIGDDLYGPADKDGKRDGKGGLKEKLGSLKQMSRELNDVLNGKQGQNKEGLAYGLTEKVQQLQDTRKKMANTWYYEMMQDVEACYRGTPVTCFSTGQQMPPAQCISAMIKNQEIGPNSTPVSNALANDDLSSGLPNLSIQASASTAQVNQPGQVDVNNQTQFLSFVQTRYTSTIQGIIAAYGSHQFASQIDRNSLLQAIQGWYNSCYQQEVGKFQASFTSGTGQFYDQYQAMLNNERETSNDEKNWLDTVEGEMTSFRTQFEKVYSNDMSQFKTNCTSNNDPYQGLDCLRQFDAELQSGISGSTVTTTLSNGVKFASSAGLTNLPVQTLALDAQGKPTIGQSVAQCSGFDDCINYMDRSLEQHTTAIQQTQNDEKKFVQQNNQAVKSAFQIVAGEFSSVTQLITAAVNGINTDLQKLGVNATVKTKNVDPETLEPDDTTGLIKMPKDMEAALAGQNAYTKIADDGTKDVTDAYNQLMQDLNNKAADAHKMKTKCQVKKSDYEALSKIMPGDCSNTAMACSSFTNSFGLSNFKNLLDKSMINPDDAQNNNSDAAREYQSCIESVRSNDDVNNPPSSAIEEAAAQLHLNITDSTESTSLAWQKAHDMAVSNLREQSKLDEQEQCGSAMIGSLASEVGKDRPPLDEMNRKLVNLLGDVSSACSARKVDKDTHKLPDSDEGVTQACEAFKSAANKANPPENYDETGYTVNGTHSSSRSDSNPYLDKSAQ